MTAPRSRPARHEADRAGAQAVAAREATWKETARAAAAELRSLAAEVAIAQPVLDGRLRALADRLDPWDRIERGGGC